MYLADYGHLNYEKNPSGLLQTLGKAGIIVPFLSRVEKSGN